ncbi:PRC and DUF2382 domain-containing protein [soil metagenome]
MISTEQIQTLLDNGGVVVDESGDKVGKIGQIYLDDESGNPEWVTTKTGLFGGSETFVPLQQAVGDDSEIRVPYSKDMIKDAPRMEDAEGHLSREQEDELYNYYGLQDAGAGGQDTGMPASGDQDTQDTGMPAAGAPVGGGDRTEGGDTTTGQDVSGRDTDDAMTRSEEQLKVGTESRESGKARLRKYVVTENVTQTVPVSHEEVRVEREPITDENRDQAMAGGDITDEEHEVTLHEERAVVDKEAVPVERVRMDTENVTEEQQVNEDVRKEEIESDVQGASTDGTDEDRRGRDQG